MAYLTQVLTLNTKKYSISYFIIMIIIIMIRYIYSICILRVKDNCQVGVPNRTWKNTH